MSASDIASKPIQLAVHGAAGRMGQRIIALASQDRDVQVVAAVESPKSSAIGRDAGELAGVGAIGVHISGELPQHVEAVIDFSTPEAAVEVAKHCELHRIPLVVATTGLSAEQRGVITAAAHRTPIVMSPSMSLAVNLAMKLVREAARVLKSVPNGVDVEIIERHHRFKEDAPSGTALKFGDIVAGEMGQTEHVHGRHGRTGKRPPTEIGYHALRTGDNVGEHTIVFGLIGETLDIAIRGHTRDSYAYGALMAAKWVAPQGPGLYSMADVLGL